MYIRLLHSISFVTLLNHFGGTRRVGFKPSLLYHDIEDEDDDDDDDDYDDCLLMSMMMLMLIISHGCHLFFQKKL